MYSYIQDENSRFACLFFRACRLKKKAQHEANKVKLQGLELEQREYLFCLHVHGQQKIAFISTGPLAET